MGEMAPMLKEGHLTVDSDRLNDFCRRWNVRRLSVFGSALRDDFGPGSDLAYAWDCWMAMRDALEFLEGKGEKDFRADKQLNAHLGGVPATKCRPLVEAWVGWLLCVEYVSDLSRRPTEPLLAPLTQLSTPLRKTCLSIVEAVRRQHPSQYRQLANQTEVLIEADLRSPEMKKPGSRNFRSSIDKGTPASA
jgi:hypothetical protein